MYTKTRGGVAPTPKVQGRLSKMTARAKHVYCTTQTANVTTTLAEAYRGNGMYDPDAATGGHQPIGFDQYTALFRQFEVKSSTIDVSVKAVVVGTDTPVSQMNVAVWADDVSSIPSTFTIKERCLTMGGVWMQTGNAYTSAPHARLTVPTSRLIKAPAGDSTIKGGDSGDPAQQWFWHVVVVNPDTTKIRSAETDVAITYDAEWTDPVMVAGS